MGDLKARLLLELPLYNYLVAGVNWMGFPLDMAGKLVSIALWALCFVLLQGIWRHVLDAEETFWANLLFVLAPLSVYFGQAFLPEMLIQALSFTMLLLLLRYLERPSLMTFVGLSLVGAVGVLLKAPEVSHLYLVVAVMLGTSGMFSVPRQKTAACRGEADAQVERSHPSRLTLLVLYLLALAFTALAMVLWGHYIDRVNSTWFPEWTSRNVVGIMVGSWKAHIEPFGYFRLVVYIILLATTIGGLPWVIAGLARVLKNFNTWRRGASAASSNPVAVANSPALMFVVAWLGSLIFYYVFWAGGSSRIHAYYNLPALAPVCLLFGIGCARWLRGAWAVRFPTGTRLAPAVLVLATALGPYWFLFHNDPVLLHATTWLREHTASTDLILVRINHRTDLCRYRHNSTVAYYAQRNIWPWVDDQTREVKDRALATATWALVTNPEQATERTEKLRRWVKQVGPLVEDMTWLERQAGFVKVYETPEFTVYKRR